MKSEFKYIGLIERFLNEEMSNWEQEQFVKKLKDNKRLSFEYEEYQKILRALEDREAIELRKKLSQIVIQDRQKSVAFNLLLIAATIIIIAALGIIIRYSSVNLEVDDNIMSDNSVSDSTIIPHSRTGWSHEKPDTLSKLNPANINKDAKETKKNNTILRNIPNPKINIASLTGPNYQISAIYSELMASNYRSGGFYLIAPKDSSLQRTNDPLSVDWRTSLKHSIFLEILNNKGELLYEECVDDVRRIVINRRFFPGIYILKFRTDRELLHMSCFLVY